MVGRVYLTQGTHILEDSPRIKIIFTDLNEFNLVHNIHLIKC